MQNLPDELHERLKTYASIGKRGAAIALLEKSLNLGRVKAKGIYDDFLDAWYPAMVLEVHARAEQAALELFSPIAGPAFSKLGATANRLEGLIGLGGASGKEATVMVEAWNTINELMDQLRLLVKQP